MRRHPSAARLTVAALAAVFAVVAQTVPQRLAEALDPAPADVLVGAVLAAVGVLLLRGDRPLPGAALVASAAVWAAVGAAPLLGGVLEDPVLRLAIVPHGLVVAVLATLPSGRLRGRRVVLLALAALAAAALAGTGLLLLPLTAVGLVAVASAVPLRDAPVTAAGLGFGGLLVAVDASTVGGVLLPAAGASTVDIGLVAVAAVLPRLLDRERLLWAAATDAAHVVGSRLGRALQSGPLQISLPSGTAWIDPAGRTTPAPAAGLEVRGPAGDLVAVLVPGPRVDRALEEPLTRLLGQVAAAARSREQERRLADDLDRSRGLLLRAGDEERRDLETRVSTVVGGRIDGVRRRLVALGGLPDLVDRADATRDELQHVGTPPPMGDPVAVAAALRALARGRASVRVDLAEAPPALTADVLWFACAEGLANAAKHVPDAAVRITVSGGPAGFLATVEDDGAGGAAVHGAGLRGLADRVADRGGTLRVTSDGTGTRLAVSIPRPVSAQDRRPLRGSPDPLMAAGI